MPDAFMIREGLPGSCAADEVAPGAQRRFSPPPRILLAANLRWTLAARLAIAFRELGCLVYAWCPQGHPLEKVRAVERIFRDRTLTSRRSLCAAIFAADPDLIIPCDDVAAMHLSRLHAHSAADRLSIRMQSAIRRSLGTPASCALASDRAALMQVAAATGVRIPETLSHSSMADLEAWSAACEFPAMLKSDNSWGGLGVVMVRDPDHARQAFLSLRRPTWRTALAQLILRRDPLVLRQRFSRAQRAVTSQAYVVGSPANRAVVCWKGEILAGISVIALQSRTQTGPATVVQVIDNEEMAEAAVRLVSVLGLSGFCGLDFVIESSTNAAYLIEMNPRATPISHLALGSGKNLPVALLARHAGKPLPASESSIANPVIAMFPQEWQRDHSSPYLQSAHHDVPWAEPDLVRDGMSRIWADRGIAARIRGWLWPGGAVWAAASEVDVARAPSSGRRPERYRWLSRYAGFAAMLV
ncbi:MAG: ATP-grasp domain-containing protein [Pseudomonadota bacterium]|nr:ATP-grasp domain-containing protein [Pseudomonadota bacterium]